MGRRCAQRDAEIVEPCVLALDVPPGHVSGAIVVCGGAIHVVDHQRGTAWIIPRLTELCEQHDVRAGGARPYRSGCGMIPDLEKAGFAVPELEGTRRPTGAARRTRRRAGVRGSSLPPCSMGRSCTAINRRSMRLEPVQDAGSSGTHGSGHGAIRPVYISPLVAATVRAATWRRLQVAALHVSGSGVGDDSRTRRVLGWVR